ncbi:MAG: DUF3108 domain-containing protein [Cytophagaceae bacterium]
MRFVLALLSVLCLSSCEPNKEEPYLPTLFKVNIKTNYYKKAEYFKYNVSYGLLNPGVLTIETLPTLTSFENKTCYSSKVNLQLSGITGWLTSLNNSYHSIIDTASYLPCSFSRQIQENKYRKLEYTVFERDSARAVVKDTTNSENPKLKHFHIKHDIDDMVSCFYLLRNIPFETMNKGDFVTIDVFMEDHSYNIRFKYIGETEIKLKKKKYNTIIVAPILPENNILSGDFPAKIYLTNNEEKIPLLMEVKLIVGTMEMTLEDYKQRGS